MRNLLQQVMDAKKYDKAIEAAKLLPLHNDMWLNIIGQRLIKIGYLGKAIEVAMLIPHDETRSRLLFIICKKLIKKGILTAAREVAKMIPKEETKISALKKMCSAFVNNSEIDMAIEVESLMPGKIENIDYLLALRQMQQESVTPNIFHERT